MKRIVLITIIVFSVFLSLRLATAERIKITGEYSYTYGDNESLVDAKNICYSMAVRNAIESYKTFIVATSTVNDYKLIKDLIQIISSGYIEDLKIAEETIKGRNIKIRVEGYIVTDVIDMVLQREVERLRGKEIEAIDDNGVIKIVNIVKRVRGSDIQIDVVIKAIIRIEDYTEDERAKVCIDYYDFRGTPLGGDCKNAVTYFTRGLIPNQIKTLSFTHVPEDTVSYRSWLLK
ncbi:MAG: hypothetical protein HY578_05450 [Nitrospinae bacterium]|nr:hypothetical protein [Nitrospinota bacterium]